MNAGRNLALTDLKGLVVLVVDDDAAMRFLLDRLLTSQGAGVLGADGAAEGRHLMKQRHPDVVISDLQMPHEDGLQFMARLRRSPDDYPRFVPAIALSSLGDVQHRQLAREAGFWRYLTKPVAAAVLCEAIGQLGRAHQRFERANQGEVNAKSTRNPSRGVGYLRLTP